MAALGTTGRVVAKQSVWASLALGLLISVPWVGRADAATHRATHPVLRDKTLVVWVAPADLTQRGGSVLTLMEGEDFDAVVLGERVPGRWMAGSDFFRRTQGEQEQQGNAPETAEPGTLVQVAVVYAGQSIAIFRDGQPYARYRVSGTRPFGRDTAVLIGLRYLGGMGAIGFFRGAIEEARIYDVPLDRATLAALQPDLPSDPAPIAQWTFADGSTADTFGRFPPGELRGGARIVGGRLLLDGQQACMVSAFPDTDDQVMFYAPKRPETGVMWDTWLYHHAGTYFLYYLARSGAQWDNVSMATSGDGVHWSERGVILRKAEGVTWMGTGSTWRSPAREPGHRFQMNFSEWRGDRQTIFFAESTNLLDWRRLGPEFEFRQDDRWYKPEGRWDCIYTIPRAGGGLWGYWTADPKAGPGVGFGWSQDGWRWEALEPPPFVEGAPHGEAGAVERIGAKYYLMLGAGGMRTLVAEQPQGPFRPAPKNFTLLHGGPTYFSRFFPTNPDGLLVNHHAIARNGRIHLGLLKRAAVDVEGTLRLVWWPGNERLKHQPLELEPPHPLAADGAIAFFGGELPTDDGVLLEGALLLPSAPEEPSAGLYVECGEDQGIALLGRPRGIFELGPVSGDGSGFAADLRVDRGWSFGRPARCRLVLKRWLLELYVDDVLIECFSLPARATGRIGVIGPWPAGVEWRAWR